MGRRKNEAMLQVRTFTWLDAERAFVYEGDEKNRQESSGERR